MTLAAHGLLYRWGQVLGERLVEDARSRGGPFQAAAVALLAERHWILEAAFFPQKVQVKGSIEVKEGLEPTCHILRGQLQRVVAAEAGPVTLNEQACQSQGAQACVFAVVKGGRAP